MKHHEKMKANRKDRRRMRPSKRQLIETIKQLRAENSRLRDRNAEQTITANRRKTLVLKCLRFLHACLLDTEKRDAAGSVLRMSGEKALNKLIALEQGYTNVPEPTEVGLANELGDLDSIPARPRMITSHADWAKQFGQRHESRFLDHVFGGKAGR